MLSVDEAKGPGLLGPRLLLCALHHAQILHSFSWGLDRSTRSPFFLHIFLVAPMKASNYKHKCRRLRRHKVPSIPEVLAMIRCAEVP